MYKRIPSRRRVLRLTLVTLCMIAGLAACDTTTNQETGRMIVVEAYLYAGEPVDDIRLKLDVPLAGADTVDTPVTDAIVRLSTGGESFVVESVGSDGRYAYAGNDLIVLPGSEFELTIEWREELITARTVVPSVPTGAAISAAQVEITPPGAGGPGGFGGGRPGQLTDDNVTVSWVNPDEELYYVVVESAITGDPEYILPEFIRDRFTGFRFVAPPTRLNVFDIQLLQLEVYGEHRATLYHVNQEYANLYENRQQDSRDLNEPPTNIVGGVGVFSAFSGVTLAFEVVAGE